MEHVWQIMWDDWLPKSIFCDHDGIIDHCCDHWDSQINQPWRTISVGPRDWAHAF
jgi:hypothetical protein